MLNIPHRLKCVQNDSKDKVFSIAVVGASFHLVLYLILEMALFSDLILTIAWAKPCCTPLACVWKVEKKKGNQHKFKT